MSPRGPYRSLTAGLSPAQAAAWFREHRCPDHRSTPESAYVNAGVSCTHWARPGKHEERGEARAGEYYHQAHDARMVG